MRGRRIIAMTLLVTAVVSPTAATAQFSPRAVLGGITRPFRAILGHWHYRGRAHRHHERQAAASGPAANGNSATHLGSTCPPTWPNAYEQALGFALWPDDYAAQFRGHGFDVIADSISGRSATPRRTARVATTGAAVASEANNGGDLHWPADGITALLQLSNSQRDALDQLETVVARGLRNVEVSCGNPDTAPQRLGALIATLWAVRDAGNAVLGSLGDFYKTLSAAQKQSFASRQPQAAVPAADSPQAKRAMQACAASNAEAAERWVKEIEMRVRPSKEQAVSFETLHKTAGDMAKLMMASCAKPIADDPLARLAAAGDTFTAMNYAATTLQIAFNDFYGRLDDSQKARFEAMSR